MRKDIVKANEIIAYVLKRTITGAGCRQSAVKQ